MNLPIALIIDKSDAFINFQKDDFLEAWQVKPEEMKQVNRVGEAGGASLFGGTTAAILVLEDIDSVKQSVNDFVALEKAGTLTGKVSKGLLIVTGVARNSTKKLEAFVEKHGGSVVTSAPAKGTKISTVEHLLSPLNLNRSAKNFIVSYVGDDYEAVIPLVKTLSNLTSEQQFNVSEQDIYVRFPQAPGSVPPWNLEKPIMRGDVNEVIDVFRRVSQHSHFLVVLAVLRNKFTVGYKVSVLLDANPRTPDEVLVEASGSNPRSLWAMKKFHKDHGTEKLEKALLEIARTEAKVKGESAAPPLPTMELMLVRLANILA